MGGVGRVPPGLDPPLVRRVDTRAESKEYAVWVGFPGVAGSPGSGGVGA